MSLIIRVEPSTDPAQLADWRELWSLLLAPHPDEERQLLNTRDGAGVTATLEGRNATAPTRPMPNRQCKATIAGEAA